ncbi:MAG: MFS transporter [Nocardioides sp.]|nr:MFS transporter [Nocardioides sp.]
MTTDGRTRTLLALCSVAVAFAAVDTYVVVLALPDMMATAGVSVDQLQRAAPIVSGFLLGYVAMLPLIGRLADLRGPVPVLAAALVLFSVGSLVTTAAYDLPSMVVGRFLQGVGGGGLVPATMSLVAALYPVERRGLPLGLVSAVQELGSVLGPLFGALVLAFTSWQGIFAINTAGGILLYAAVRATGGSVASASGAAARAPRRFPDPVALVLLVVALASAALVVHPPDALYLDLTWGAYFVPVVSGGGRWLWPVGLVAIGAFVLFWVRCLTARRPLVDVREWWRTLRSVDLVGAVLLALALGGVVLAFATADPAVSVFSPQGPWLLLASAVATGALAVHLRRTDDPLVPGDAVSARPAWGSLVVSLMVGWALIAALVDIPLFARTTVYRDSQLDAALVLLRFLVALPVGAVVGGWLTRRLPAWLITAAGMLAASLGFWVMSGWDVDSLRSAWSTVPLVVAGLGFGLALAPVNAAILATTRDDTHGVASALVVVARMVGMLVGISVLTTWGLRQLYEARADDPSLSVTELGIVQEQSVFLGAAVVALLAAVLAVLLLRGAPTREVDLARALRAAG